MTPFLQQVAGHYYRTGEIWTSCFVFPNRRSLAFFRKYLTEAVAADPQAQTRWAPQLCTINDFFYRAGHFAETDKITLLLELYQVYRTLSPLKEDLDEFIFWGDVLLGDFDDVDKYLVDAEGLFANVADLKDIQDAFSYLTPKQEEAIRRFAGHFKSAAPKDGKKDIKGRFLQIWNILRPLYTQFRERLRSKGMAYEGMVYRDLAERLSETPVADILREKFPYAERFVFVGLNALNECERKVLSKMQDAGLARFSWDYRSRWIRDPLNKSSLFMKDFTERFRSDLETDPEGLQDPEIHIISVPSGVGQAKLLPRILGQCPEGDWLRTAVVLPDESLLTPVLSSIPPEVADINVTMGYPMTGSALFTLMSRITAMQMHLRERPGDGWYFYHRQVRSILSGSLLRSVLTPEEAAVCARVTAEAKYYIPEEDLRGGLLSEVFRPVVRKPSESSAEQNAALFAYLLQVVRQLAVRLREKGVNRLELDFAKRYYTAVSQLAGISLAIRPATCMRLIDQALSTLTVPFSGEPLKGLQVMGPLETRALDFDNVILLSCNEGIFPRRSVSASFIPPELRRGFGLPTYEYQDAVWAYYFYRLIQRASRVWLIYDSRTEGIKTGEESRYIKQLQYHFPGKLHIHGASASVRPASREGDIPKTEEDIALIRAARLSASSLQNYLTCPARFYYQVVKRLKGTDDVAENLDAGMVGTVFHAVMQGLYTRPGGKMTLEDLETARRDKEGLRRRIMEKICGELRCLEVSGRDLVTAGVIGKYVDKALSRDIEYLRSHGAAGFEILGLERELDTSIGDFRLHGVIDRLDRIPGGKLRVVDYKTGKVTDGDIDVTDDTAEKVVEALFGDKNEKRPKIALQLYLYDLLVSDHYGKPVRELTNAIYSTSRLMASPVRDVPSSGAFTSLMEERLKGLLSELVDPSVPFRRKAESRVCEYCDFKTLCGL